MESTAVFNHKGKFKDGDYANVGEVDGAKSVWVIPQDMTAAYFSYSIQDPEVTQFDIEINGVVADSIAVSGVKGTGSLDIEVVAGDELTLVNNGDEVKEAIIVITFASTIPINPGTPIYELTLELFYRITPVAFQKYLNAGSRILESRGVDYVQVGSALWAAAEELAQGAKDEGA